MSRIGAPARRRGSRRRQAVADALLPCHRNPYPRASAALACRIEARACPNQLNPTQPTARPAGTPRAQRRPLLQWPPPAGRMLAAAGADFVRGGSRGQRGPRRLAVAAARRWPRQCGRYGRLGNVMDAYVRADSCRAAVRGGWEAAGAASPSGPPRLVAAASRDGWIDPDRSMPARPASGVVHGGRGTYTHDMSPLRVAYAHGTSRDFTKTMLYLPLTNANERAAFRMWYEPNCQDGVVLLINHHVDSKVPKCQAWTTVENHFDSPM